MLADLAQVHGGEPAPHDFRDGGAATRQGALTAVTWLTLATMGVELAAGWWSGSLALTADGWHMGTHALALGGAVLAYRLSLWAAGRIGYAWWCDAEAARTGASMRDLELMREIERYNEVDCRAMAEIVAWLRPNR